MFIVTIPLRLRAPAERNIGAAVTFGSAGAVIIFLGVAIDIWSLRDPQQVTRFYPTLRITFTVFQTGYQPPSLLTFADEPHRCSKE